MLSKKRQAEREQLTLEQQAEFEALGGYDIPESPLTDVEHHGEYLNAKDAVIDCMMEEGARPSAIYEALLDVDWLWGGTDLGYAEMRLDFYYMKDPKKRICH